MTLSGVAKFLTGFTLAIAILFYAGASTTRYLISRLTTPPPKPLFENDLLTETAEAPPAKASEASAEQSEQQPATPTPSLEPGTYAAVVTQPIGLILRDGPNLESGQIGGVEYNAEITVLGMSSDGGWMQVRLSDGSEGWVRAGNAERVN